jgi:hypothetical protein
MASLRLVLRTVTFPEFCDEMMSIDFLGSSFGLTSEDGVQIPGVANPNPAFRNADRI